MSTPTAPSAACVRPASNPPQRVEIVWVRAPRGADGALPHVRPPPPLPGPQLPGTRNCRFQEAEHSPQINHLMDNALIESLLTQDLSKDE